MLPLTSQAPDPSVPHSLLVYLPLYCEAILQRTLINNRAIRSGVFRPLLPAYEERIHVTAQEIVDFGVSGCLKETMPSKALFGLGSIQEGQPASPSMVYNFL